MLTGPADPHGGQLRASRTDREQAIEALKAAFVRDLLTKGEFDGLIGQALASRTYAELAVVTASIPATPAAPATTGSGPGQPAPGRRPVPPAVPVLMAEGTLTAALWWAGLLLDNAFPFVASFIVAMLFFLTLFVVWAHRLEQRRSRRRQPPIAERSAG